MEKIEREFKRIQEHQVYLRREIGEKTVSYILAAFGFVVGLAWNEAIKSLIDTFFPNSGNGVLIKFGYAIIITIFIVILSVYLLKLTKNNNT